VRWKDLAENDTTTPWDDFISEDFDPEMYGRGGRVGGCGCGVGSGEAERQE